MILFKCPECGQALSAQDAQVGMLVPCPKCRARFKVPGNEAPLPATATVGAAVGGGGGATLPPRPNFNVPGSALSFRNSSGGGRRYGFNCGYCSSRLEATESMAAQDGQCPTCGNTITIPIQDRYGRLIDPKTRQIIKQDPHPVHAYAAAGERAPRILRQNDGKQIIRCARCSTANPISSNNCKACGMPFTMEGTTIEAAGASNGFCVASLVLGIIGMVTCFIFVTPILALIFGFIGYMQTSKAGSEGGGKKMAIAGMILGALGCMAGLWVYLH